MSELKTVGMCVVIRDKQMFLQISMGAEQVELPHEEAVRFSQLVNALVPYRYGQKSWYIPVKFIGRT